MSLTGVWSNSYGSVMNLSQFAGGLIAGTYSSSTGSTGKYYVAGMAGPSDPTPSLGQSAALSIYWRSYTGGQGDPSWHWVSGLSGQLNTSGSQPTLYLMHAMVATDNFPNVANVGTYIDKLIYTPKQGETDSSIKDALSEGANGTDPISGVWVCNEEPGTIMQLSVSGPSTGYVTGDLACAAGRYVLVGFTDVDAQSGGIARQGLSVSVGVGDAGVCMSMAGSLDFSTGVMTLTVYASRGTSADTIYTQTQVSQWTFTKSSDD